MTATDPRLKKTGCLDVSRTAEELARKHGRDAVSVASRWSRCAATAGDPQRSAAWRRVVETLYMA